MARSGLYNHNMQPGKHCYQCKDRELGCHSKCEKYQIACAEWAKYKSEIDAKRQADIEYDEFKIERVKSTRDFMKKHKFSQVNKTRK